MSSGWWFLGMHVFWWVFWILLLVWAYRYVVSALKRPGSDSSDVPRTPPRIPLWLGFCLFLAIALFFLLQEHRAHFLGALPYVLLLLCPIIHMLMHRDHGVHGQEPGGHAGHRHHQGGPGGTS